MPKEDPATLKPAYLRQVLSMMWATWPLLLGNTLEWYEFSVYGYVEEEIKENFFHGSAFATWIGFGVTFAARPIGGLVLGWLADRVGRKLSVTLSLGGMIVATAGQGLLPAKYFGSGAQGFGLVLLVLLRAVQGLSAGGEIGAVSAYLMEVSPMKTLGMAVCFISVGSTVACSFAAALMALLNGTLSQEQMLVWGWRVPFLLSLPPGLLAMWGRRSLAEDDVSLEENTESASEGNPHAGDEACCGGGAAGRPVYRYAAMELLMEHPRALVLGFGATVAIATMWYVPPFWTLSALLHDSLGATDSLLVGNANELVALAVTPLAGWLTDRYGVGLITAVGAAFFALVALPVYSWLSFNTDSVADAYIAVGLVFGFAQGFSGATIYLYCAELFPARVRCLGLALSYNLAVSYVGGFGSSISQALFGLSPHFAPGIYWSAIGATSFLTVLLGLWWQKRGLVRLTHRRAQPYMGMAACRAATTQKEPQLTQDATETVVV